jgi:hypothetical protein
MAEPRPQLARAKLGFDGGVIRRPPDLDPAQRSKILGLDEVRAAEMPAITSNA